MKSTTAKFLLTAAIPLILTSCAETRKMVVECGFPDQPPPQGPALVSQEYGETSPIPLNAVQYVSPSLVEQVAVQNLKARRSPTQTVQIHARLINCSDEPMVVGVRAHFMDNDQVPTEKESAWQNVVMQPHALGHYKESSIKPSAVYYLLEVRDAR
jgi:hypothetical protein